MNRDALAHLSKNDLIALVLAQVAENAALTKRVSELEAKLGQPPKTPDNSSLPPSQGHKPNRAERRVAKKRKGRPGVFRKLAKHPDRVVEARAAACPHCAHGLTAADQPDFHAYDHIELPVIRPLVTRLHRHRGTCPCCRRRFSAPVPERMAPGSPFGPGIAALIVHLHVTQAIGFERLSRLMAEVFGLAISEGAIANLLARAAPRLTVAAETIARTVRASPVVASDETSARVDGANWWQWVWLTSTAVRHVIADSRAAKVVTGFLDGTRPEVWVADRYGAQAGHGRARQVCLAHLLRDAQFAIDAGDIAFAPGFKKLLVNACAIGRRRDALKDTTLAQYRYALDRRLDRLLAAAPTTGAGGKLARAIRRCRGHGVSPLFICGGRPRVPRGDMFVFLARRDVPYTNNGCERALRPSVVFRKVTGCFRSEWGAHLYAAALSVIATGRLNDRSALQALTDALAARPIFAPP